MPSLTLDAAIGGDLDETTPTTPVQAHHLVEQARGAQSVFETFSQEQVDAIVRDFGKYVYDNAEAVAAMAHKETGLGVYEDKVLKAQSKARVIWNNLKGKKSRGIIGEDAEQNLVLIAKPMGVVGDKNQVLLRVFPYDPTRLLALEIVPDDPRLALSLKDLVFVDAEAGLLVCHGGHRLCVVVD